MSSSQSLRDFIRERLTAAAEEIFTEFDKTIVQYEEELDRQRRLLEICLKPRIELQRIDLSHLFNEQKSHSNLDQGETKPLGQNQEDPGPQDPLLVKKEQDEPELPQIQIEPFELKQEADTFIENLDYDEKNLSQTEPNFDQLVVQFSSEKMNQTQERNDNEDSGSSTDAKLRQIKGHRKIRKHCNIVDKPKVEKQKKRQMKENLRDGKVSHTTPRTKDRPFLCVTCGKGFRHASNLCQHKKIHSGHKPHLCVTCGKRFIRKNQLMYHLQTHTDQRPFSCKIRGKLFKGGTNLSEHAKIHSDHRPHLCAVCGKGFIYKSNLTSHIQTHTGDKAFSCKICGKRFNNSGNLSRHNKIHSGHRPHLCPVCDKGFIRKSQLTSHIQTHTGEKAFSCKICGKRFNNSANLSRHNKIHSGHRPHLCTTCGKRFIQKTNLTSHIKTHK